MNEGLLYDEQGRVVAELDGSNNVLSTFVYGLKPNVPDYMVRGGVAYRIVSDWRGDVRLVLDTTKTGAAAVVEQIDYDEWGNVDQPRGPELLAGRDRPLLPALRLRRRCLGRDDRARQVRGAGLRSSNTEVDTEGPD